MMGRITGLVVADGTSETECGWQLLLDTTKTEMQFKTEWFTVTDKHDPLEPWYVTDQTVVYVPQLLLPPSSPTPTHTLTAWMPEFHHQYLLK